MLLSKRQQVGTVVSATGQDLSWALSECAKQTHQWSQGAGSIPDDSIRAAAMRTFERGHLAGATLFATLNSHRNPELLRAVLAYQTIVDFLDDLHQRHPTAVNGQRLYLALVDALIPGGPLPDYYAHHCAENDAGYLSSLIQDCRRHCAALPSFTKVQTRAVREARRTQRALTVGHCPDETSRERGLRRWVEREFPASGQWRWYEQAAAASGQLSTYVLLALAAKADLEEGELDVTHAAYWPVIPALTTMLESLSGDGDHRYIAHYQGRPADRLTELIEIAAGRLADLPDGDRQRVVLASMIALSLVEDNALSEETDSQRRQLLERAGALPQALVSVLKPWRTTLLQHAA